MVFPRWPDRALGGAGTALEWKCTSEEFLFSFRECHKRLSRRFRFCEERSVVSVFSLEPGRAAHLQSISRKGCSREAASRPPDRTWVGGPFAWNQPLDPWKWPPCPPIARAALPHWPSQIELGWTDSVAAASGTEYQDPESLCFPACSAILRSLQLQEKMVKCRGKRIWSHD